MSHRLPEVPLGEYTIRAPLHLRVGSAAAAMLVATAAITCAGKVSTRVTTVASGYIVPKSIIDIRSSRQGTIVDVTAYAGKMVEQGDTLALLDTVDSDMQLELLDRELDIKRAQQLLQLRSSEQSTRQAEERAERAKLNVVRMEAAFRSSLVESGKFADIDSLLRSYVPGNNVRLDAGWSDLQAARFEQSTAENSAVLTRTDTSRTLLGKAEIAALEVRRAAALQDRSTLVVRASRKGIVLTDHTESLVGTQVQTGDLLFELGEPGPPNAEVRVSARELREIQVGQRAFLQFPGNRSFDGVTLEASVFQVPMSASRASLANQDARIILKIAGGTMAKLGSPTPPYGQMVRARIVILEQSVLRRLWHGLTSAP